MSSLRAVRPPRPGDVDFTAVGEISLDTLAIGRDSKANAGKETVESIVDLPGGQAATAAVACQRLGWRSRWIGAVGDDEAGERSLAALTNEGVEPVAITRAGVPSRRAVILIDPKNGDRQVFQHRDDRLNLAPGEVAAEVFGKTRVLLVDGSDPAHAIHAARIARSHDVRTIVDVDTVWPGLDELLQFIDVVVLPGPIVEAASGVPALAAGLAEICRRSGAQAAIATLGSEGAIAWAGGRERRVPALPIKAVDTTGAGDAFRAGLAASWLGRADSRPDLDDFLAGASYVAGLACRAVGAQTALPTALEVPPHLCGGV